MKRKRMEEYSDFLSRIYPEFDKKTEQKEFQQRM